MTIFGISLIDNFGFDFISNFLNEVRIIAGNIFVYLTDTRFYSYLKELFSSSKSEPSSESKYEIRSMIERNNEKTNGNTKSIEEYKGNSRIHDWLKPEAKIEEISKETGWDNTTYYIIGLIIFGVLSWYYFDSIKDTGSNLIDWIKSFRRDDDPGNNNRGIWVRETRINPREDL